MRDRGIPWEVNGAMSIAERARLNELRHACTQAGDMAPFYAALRAVEEDIERRRRRMT